MFATNKSQNYGNAWCCMLQRAAVPVAAGAHSLTFRTLQ